MACLVVVKRHRIAILTIYDYLMVMTKPLRVAEFKAKLSAYLRSVRSGRELTIYDRDQPIARVVPIGKTTPLAVREPVTRYATLCDIPLPPPLRQDGDIVDLLLEDRRERR